MEIIYINGRWAYVNQSKADITPNAKWYPDINREHLFEWNNDECKPYVNGCVKYGHLNLDMTMSGYLKYDNMTMSISRGYVDRFH